MTAYEIPLSPEPQSFTISLAGVTRKLRFYWSPFEACWCFDLGDNKGNMLIEAAPVITGVDLLAPYKHLQIGGSLVAQTDSDPDAPPTFDNLGSQGHLFFLVP